MLLMGQVTPAGCLEHLVTELPVHEDGLGVPVACISRRHIKGDFAMLSASPGPFFTCNKPYVVHSRQQACAQKKVSRFGYAVISPLAVSVSYQTWIKCAWSINWTKSSISQPLY